MPRYRAGNTPKAAARQRSKVKRCNMDQNIKKLWCDTLRSGTIKQATRVLQNASGAMCCLGVLMTVQGQKPIDYFKRELPLTDYNGVYGVKRCNWSDVNDALTDRLQSATVPGPLSAGIAQTVMDTLAAMNDGSVYEGITYPQHDFAQIAAWIEENLP